jgi:hypothetical protein
VSMAPTDILALLRAVRTSANGASVNYHLA